VKRTLYLLLPFALAACGGDLDSTPASTQYAPINPTAVKIAASQKEIEATSQGIVGDGTTLNTTAIQAALDAAAKSGNATLVFPAGTYLTGALFVKSNTQIRLENGATLLGVQNLALSTDPGGNKDYPMINTRVQGYNMDWPAALINVDDAQNVRIYGEGTIDGHGEAWWDRYSAQSKSTYPGYHSGNDAYNYDQERPRLIEVLRSQNVEIQGLTLTRSPFWTMHLVYSDQLHVDAVKVRNVLASRPSGTSYSTDGVDIDSSSNALVENNDIEDDDDTIVLKSGRDADGIRTNRPTENVLIRNNIVRHGYASVTFGSETSGGIRHVEIYGTKDEPGVRNAGTDPTVSRAVAFKSSPTRGGVMEDINIHDIQLDSVAKAAITVDLSWTPAPTQAPDWVPRPLSEAWQHIIEPIPAGKGDPVFRNVRIANLKAGVGNTNTPAFTVNATEASPLHDFTLENVEITAPTAGTIASAKDWKITGSHIRTADQSLVNFTNSSATLSSSDGFRAP
jgi:polygalacturonase